MRKAGLLVLAAALMTGGLLGCAKDEGKEEGAGPSVAPTGSGITEEKPIEISWLSFDFPEKDGNLVQTWMEQKFNVKINNMRIDRSNWRDQLNIRLATNDVPDVWLLWGVTDVEAYSKQGLLTELPIDEIRAELPELAQFIDSSDPDAWNNGKIDGKNYGVPITNLDGIYPVSPIYNGKWLEAIGYSEPPKTLAELEDVLYKFRNNDPDGNGKKDTYGLTLKGKSDLGDALPAIFGAFGIQPMYWQPDADGKLVFGMVTEQAREAFRLLNKWFKDGVLDPEFITADGKKEEFVNGIVGMSNTSWAYIRPNGSTTQLAEKNGFNIVTGKALEGPYGSGKLLAYGLTSNYIGMGINVEQDPAKKKKIYEILRSFYTEEESMLYSQFGEEGVHYTVENGKPVAKPEYQSKDEQMKLGIGNYYGLFSRKTIDFEKILYNEEDLAYRQEASEGVELLIDKVKFSVPSLANYPDLKNMEKEYFIKFITGDVDLDQGFDQFVDKWKKAGGQAVTDEANTLYEQNRNN